MSLQLQCIAATKMGVTYIVYVLNWHVFWGWCQFPVVSRHVTKSRDMSRMSQHIRPWRCKKSATFTCHGNINNIESEGAVLGFWRSLCFAAMLCLKAYSLVLSVFSRLALPPPLKCRTEPYIITIMALQKWFVLLQRTNHNQKNRRDLRIGVYWWCRGSESKQMILLERW